MHDSAKGTHVNKDDQETSLNFISEFQLGNKPNANNGWRKSRSSSEGSNVKFPKTIDNNKLPSYDDVCLIQHHCYHGHNFHVELNRDSVLLSDSNAALSFSSLQDRPSSGSEVFHEVDNAIWDTDANVNSEETLNSTKSCYATPSHCPPPFYATQQQQQLAFPAAHQCINCPSSAPIKEFDSKKGRCDCRDHSTSVRRSWSLIEASAFTSSAGHHHRDLHHHQERFCHLKKSPSHGGLPINICTSLDIPHNYHPHEVQQLRPLHIDVTTRPCSCSSHNAFPIEDSSATSDQESVPRSRKHCTFVSLFSIVCRTKIFFGLLIS